MKEPAPIEIECMTCQKSTEVFDAICPDSVEDVEWFWKTTRWGRIYTYCSKRCYYGCPNKFRTPWFKTNDPEDQRRLAEYSKKKDEIQSQLGYAYRH